MRQPPHSTEAEQALLSGIMLDPRAWDQVADRVSASDLYRTDHRHIFTAIAEVVELGQPPDAGTVGERLSKQGRLVIARRPSTGKTALALNIAACAAARNRISTGILSMEMSKEQIMFRLIGSMARVNQKSLRTGRLSDADWQRITKALDELNDAPLFIDDAPALKPTEVRARARRLKSEHDLGLFVVDYLQFMQTDGSNENRTTEISRISQALKSLARELNVPAITLSRLNRSVEQRTDKRPMMSDLRESGAIEQDADVIIFIYREEFYDKETPEKGLAEIIVSKQRNGETGKVRLVFKGEFTRFENHVGEDYGVGVTV